MDITKIFICYSQDDFMGRGFKLRNYLSKVITDSDVYIDQKKTKGQNWKEINDKKLNEADIVLAILTPAALRSSEVAREIEIATKLKKRIIPCKDDSLDLEWSEIPWELHQKDGVTFEDDEILKTRLYKEITKIIKELRSAFPPIAEEEEFTIDLTMSIIPVRVNNQNYEILYSVDKNTTRVNLGTIDKESSSIVFDVECKENSTVELTLPRVLIDCKSGNEDDTFFVLVDGMDTKFIEKKTSEERTLEISILKDCKEIEIIGTQILGISSIGITKPQNVVKILFNSHNMHGGKYLEPEILAINAGEKVRWENKDVSSHTITSGKPNDDTCGSQFDSGLFKSGGTFEITFNEKGTYEYCCVVHPWKTGRIIVK